MLGTATTHLIPNPQLQRLLPVDSEEGEIGNPFYADIYVRSPRTTIGRMVNRCGHIGVITRAST